jgi:maleylacetate reductase
VHEFRYVSYAQEIIFGAGSLGRLSEAVERYGWRRLVLVSTGSLRRGGQIAALENALGERVVAIYEHVQPHVPDYQVAEVAELARSKEADGIIGMGGGSPIGMAKAVNFALADRREFAKRSSTDDRRPTTDEPPRLPVIAIPTTYAGSEMTPVYGVTRHGHDREPARKITVSDPTVTPRLVLYDPMLTLDLSPVMTASTGINALAHCMEAFYSITRSPISTAVALGGVRAIFSALPRCYADGSDLDARTRMLEGAMLAGMALAHVAMGLHHGLCHVLGGSAGVPHGIANGIILPHALRFNVAATAPQLAQAAEPMGIPYAGRSAEAATEEVIEHIDVLIREMGLPQRMRDVGVREADLGGLAKLALESRAVKDNPRQVTDAAEIEAILRAAW